METSELLLLRLLSQQQALNAAISSLRAVGGAATCSLSLASTANAAAAAALLTAEAAEGQLADLHKQNAALKKELEKATASLEDDLPMQTSTNNEIFTVIYYVGGRLYFPRLYLPQLYLVQKLRVEAAD